MSDLIDRDFIKSLGGKCIAYRDEKTNELFPIIGIDAFPSAQPERKKGKWIHGREIMREMLAGNVLYTEYEDYHCSECGVVVDDHEVQRFKFCPNCGAEMET